MNDQQFDKFLQLSSALSPENLHCDGEISQAEAMRKYKRIMKEWRALEHEFGRKVDEDEIWEYYMKERVKVK